MVARSLFALCSISASTLGCSGIWASQIDFESLELGPLDPSHEWGLSGAVSTVKPGLDYIGPFGGFKEGGSRSLELSAHLSEPAAFETSLDSSSFVSVIMQATQAEAVFEITLNTDFTLVLDFATASAFINDIEVALPQALSTASPVQLVIGSVPDGSTSIWFNPSEVQENSPFAIAETANAPAAQDLAISVLRGAIRIDTIETGSLFTDVVPSASTPGHLVINGQSVTTEGTDFPTENGSVTIDHASELYAGNETVRVEAIAAPNHVLRYLNITRNGRIQVYYDSVVNLAINGDTSIEAVFGLIHREVSFEADEYILNAENDPGVEAFNILLASAYKDGTGGATGFDDPIFGAPLSHTVDSNQAAPPSGEALDLQLTLVGGRTLSIRNGSRTALETVDEYGHANLDHRAAVRWDGELRYPLHTTSNAVAADGSTLSGATTYEFVFDPGDEISAVGLSLLLDMTGMGTVIEESAPLLRLTALLSDGGSSVDYEFDPEAPAGLHRGFYSFESPSGLSVTSLIVVAQCGITGRPSLDIDALGVISRSGNSVNIQGQTSGDGEVHGSGSYSPGETVTLAATPASGNVFLRWNLQGVSRNPLETIASESTTITAEFGPAPREGGVFTAAFKSDGDRPWTAHSDAAWLVSNARSDKGYLLVDFELAPNVEADAREATIEIRSGDDTITHSVIQIGWAQELLGNQAEPAGNGWVGLIYETSWIGEIEVASNQGQPFLRTDAHGWWYVSDDGEAFWAFDFDSNQWLWVHPSSWPTIYCGAGGWMTWSGATAPRWFFSYTLNDWTTLEQI